MASVLSSIFRESNKTTRTMFRSGAFFKYLKPPRVGNRCCDATLYWNSDASLDLPDIFSCQLGPNDAAIAKFGIPADTWGMFVGLAHPKSRGWYVSPVPMHPILS